MTVDHELPAGEIKAQAAGSRLVADKAGWGTVTSHKCVD